MPKNELVEMRLRFDSSKVTRKKLVSVTENALRPLGVEVWVKDR